MGSPGSDSSPPKGAHEIRQRFLDYFAARGHEVVRSAPLVPQNDPTLLFINAGMVQFKDVFTGRDKRPYTRAASSQRCLRAGGKHNDLDNVGFTPRHHTLFEMLGNFSFGDYFKAEAIDFAWKFLTDELGIEASRLCVSVFNGEGEDAPFDQEAFDLWQAYLPKERIYAFDSKENFWSMGDTGPCGPCSEIHIYRGGDAPPDAGQPNKGPAFEDDRYLELWNLVFMQYEKHASGEMTELPAKSIDTGAGLERLAAVLAGVESNYETALLEPLVALAKKLAGVAGPQGEDEGPYQVIADHARAASFLIADGVFPDRTGRSYVLRRIMRRAIRYGTRVGLEEPFFHEVCAAVIDQFGEAYPELRAAAATIEEVVRTEETAFRRTLQNGLRRLAVAIDELEAGTKAFPPDVAADLYSTYGFPVDLTGLIAKEHALELDEQAAMQIVKSAGEGGEFGGAGTGVADVYFEVANAHDNEFLGYVSTAARGKVLAIIKDGVSVDRAQGGDAVELVFDKTPFYAESGGQVGDAGYASRGGTRVKITDCKKPAKDVHFHAGTVEVGDVAVGDELELRVDEERRDAIRRNHSATHLLHHALREVLGTHVTQKGSLVEPERLRFDFSHNKPMSSDQKREIERRVNAQVLRNAESTTREMALDAAKEAGAMGLFGEKYGDEVRVVSIGSDSVELCGGTHVARAGDIGLFSITGEGGIAQGVRRIEAVTGEGALHHVQHLGEVIDEAALAVKAANADEVLVRIEQLQASLKKRDDQIAKLQRQLATGGGQQDEVVDVSGIKLLAKAVPGADTKSLRDAADALRDRLKSGVVVLAAEHDGKAMLLVAVTKDLAKRVHAGKLVGELAKHVDGRGGGRPDLAQAGGPNAKGIPAAVAGAEAALRAQL